MTTKQRYEVHTGKWGQYFYDTGAEEDMPLNTVLGLLNDYEKMRADLARCSEQTTTIDELDCLVTSLREESRKHQWLNVLSLLHTMLALVLNLFNHQLKQDNSSPGSAYRGK